MAQRIRRLLRDTFKLNQTTAVILKSIHSTTELCKRATFCVGRLPDRRSRMTLAATYQARSCSRTDQPVARIGNRLRCVDRKLRVIKAPKRSPPRIFMSRTIMRNQRSGDNDWLDRIAGTPPEEGLRLNGSASLPTLLQCTQTSGTQAREWSETG